MKDATTPSLPSDVQIGPHRYRVGSDRAELNAAAAEMGSQLLGHSDHKTLAITLDQDLAPSAKRETLLHAVFDQTALSVDLGEKDEERAILRLSPALLDILRRNPKLVAYLVSE